MEEVYKDVVVSELTRDDMAKLWPTKNLLRRYERGLLVLHHSLNHFTFKSLIILFKRVIIPINLSKVRNSPLVFPNYLVSPTRYNGITRVNTQVDLSGIPWKPDPGP